MVASLDGSTVWRGRSAGLAGPADVEVLHHTRSNADAIVVGAGTVRAEGYPPSDVRRLYVVSARAELDWSHPLWSHPNTVLITAEDTAGVPTDIATIRSGSTTVDLRAAMSMADDHVVQCEGGAKLLGAMLDADLIDEWFVTMGRIAVGGAGPRLTDLPHEIERRFDLAHVLHEDGDLFARYVRASER
jgi:riboflavin biosynthesis pyrimidine reductase